MHIWVGGDMGPGTSPNDPVFFLHHCNVDRFWALWQHAHPGLGYLPAAGGPPGHNLNDVMQHLTIAGATPANASTTGGRWASSTTPIRRSWISTTPTVKFQDVPTLETTWRAAVFHVRAARRSISKSCGQRSAAPYG